ncbi:MAG: hypothetical protein RLZ10_2523 [Bacteroidota bacterium]|jgi:acetyltransferase-like isoleucine patch superfamily enzyme
MISILKKYFTAVFCFTRFKRIDSNSIRVGKNNRIHKSVVIDNAQHGKISIGSNNEILNGCILMSYGGSITIGDNCSINPYTILYGHGKGLIIGNNVLIAGHCLIIPANHIFYNIEIPINQQGIESKGIHIEDDVWIGAGCQILDGVVIGRGSVIGAGSVVNKNIEPYSIAVGNPARVIKKRTLEA